MPASFPQDASGAMTYPARRTLNRLLFKTPVIWWRMGLRPLLWRSMILVTTWGRKSRLPRNTMLSYTLDAGKAYLISGWGARVDWYRNAVADPHTTAQLGGRPYSAIARRVECVEEYGRVMQIMLRTGGDSHFRLWLKSLDIAYDLDDLLAKRDRVFLVALDPTDQAGPPAMRSDLTWIWVGMLLALAIVGGLVWRLMLALR